MISTEAIGHLVCDTLQLRADALPLNADTPLLGHVPELDSMAIVALINGLESRFAIQISDDDISADVFETLGSLTDFVNLKQAA